ncbi:MAG: hypothetical protein CSA26_04510 [Desulfobacterales bacterium]|nr:MAG: hypothetical protein CSA26_04510 [Desulfobacterales bacterium]
MKILKTLKKVFVFKAFKLPQRAGLARRNYSRLRFILFSSIFIIAFGPTLITAWLGYENYQDLLQKEEREQLEWRLDGSIKSISALIDSLKAAILFVAREDRYSELISDRNIDQLFLRMQRQYAFLADLGVIDSQGIQRAYYGPYDLRGRDYSAEPWLQEVRENGYFISKVYLGYRQVPHFAVAVANIDPITHMDWVLRVTIDASTLQRFVDTIKTSATNDLFIVDNQGVLQTASRQFGAVLDRYPDAEDITSLQHNFEERGDRIFHAIGKIPHTPWHLILIEKRYVHHEDYVTFRTKLVIIVSSCLFLSFIVVYTLVMLLTNLIKKSDEMQLKVLQEAEHTDRLASIGRLAAGVGHEINNPLAIIDQKTGLIEDLMDISGDFENKQVIGESLQGINQSVARCKAITHRLLGFARRSDVLGEDVQINHVIEEVLSFLENSMVHSRIKLDLHLYEDLPLIKSDHLQLQQIFLNIINNAIDAIGKDGVVTIFTQRVAGEVRVVIQDDGPGIPEEIVPRIFEPFFTTKETGKGTGLGLSITYGLIKRLGGDISVRSHSGQGTAFTLTFPIERRQDDRTDEK